jgi:tetratricopeptide (TPR) repeat protein
MNIKTVLICLVFALLAQCGELAKESNLAESNGQKKIAVNNSTSNNGFEECSSDITGKEDIHRAYIFTNDLEFEKAIPAFECAFKKGQDGFEDKIEYIQTLYRLKRYDKVIEQCQLLLAHRKIGMKGNAWVTHKILADSLLETQRYEEALREIKIVRELDFKNRDSVSYLYKIAIALDGLGKSSEALAAYEKYMEKAPDNEPQNSRMNYAKKRILELKQQLENNQT